MAVLLYSKVRKLRSNDNPYGAMQEGAAVQVDA
jgi:hypothetical protein